MSIGAAWSVDIPAKVECQIFESQDLLSVSRGASVPIL
jgi:hypothetical protein